MSNFIRTFSSLAILGLTAAASVAANVAIVAPVALAQDLKVLNVARTSPFKSLDPVKQFDSASGELVSMAYSTLLTYSYLERPYKLTPDLLAKMPEVGADKVTYTFTLRKGVRFHDNKCFNGGKGREVNSDDVLYSLKRFADSSLNTASYFALEGMVVGMDDFREATKKAGGKADYTKLDIAGFKKINAHTFTIKVKRENPLFLYGLAISSASIVAREAVETYKDQFDITPVGTGPFIMKDFERKGIIRFVKNPDYYGTYPTAGEATDKAAGHLEDAGKKLPLVDVVELPLIEESQPEALKFLKGELDWRGLDRANFTKMVVKNKDGTFSLKDEFKSKFEIYWTPGLDTGYLHINQKDPLLGKNKVLRKALAHLVDTKGSIEVLANGRGRKLNSIVPYELAGNERDTGATYYDYNVAEAKKLLAEAGFPEGKGLAVITVSYGDTSADTRTAFDFLKGKFAAAGVQLKANFQDYDTHLKNQEAGNFQLATGGWQADYSDAENFYQLLYSKNVAPGPNASSFTNADYDKAYEASRFMVNSAERFKHFKQMNDIIKEEVPIIITSNSLRFGIRQKWLSNFKRSMMVRGLEFFDIDAEKKKKGL